MSEWNHPHAIANPEVTHRNDAANSHNPQDPVEHNQRLLLADAFAAADIDQDGKLSPEVCVYVCVYDVQHARNREDVKNQSHKNLNRLTRKWKRS